MMNHHKPPAIPNNFGPTLLIIAGLWLTPVLVGIPILWLGITQLRDHQGRRSFALGSNS